MQEESMLSRHPRVFIGAPIDVESERLLLRELYDLLGRHMAWSVVLANFHCGGRQIDFVVGSDRCTLLIEAKQYLWPVEGAENGQWSMRFSAGNTRTIRNAYRQALDAKHLLRDQIGRPNEAGYPHACVVAIPSLPACSVVPSDSKVTVCGLPGLEQVLQQQSSLRLQEQDWLTLAQSLSLEPIGDLEMAFDESLNVASRQLDAYLDEFARTYGDVDVLLRPDSYRSIGTSLARDAAVDLIFSDASITLVKGPSGCGKSLLGKYAALVAARRGVIPIIIQAKYFQGELRESLNREVALLGAASVAQLLASIRRLGRTCLLVIDGYNECSSGEQLTLSRSIRAFSRRYGAACVVSSQIDLEGVAAGGERTLMVTPPSSELKRAIAAAAAGSAALASTASALLDVVQTGLEADLIGQVGAELGPHAGTFAVFDRFVRRKLGDQDAEGIGFLAALAGSLVEGATFSTTTSQVDRLAHRTRIPAEMRRRLIAAKVLAERVDRVSFGHELFMQAFSAEWAVREAAGSIEAILTTLASPRFSRSKNHILGALDNPDLQQAVLERLTDTEILLAAHAGMCGETARSWAKARFDTLLEMAVEEANRLYFKGKDGDLVHVQIDPATRQSWSKEELAVLAGVVHLVCTGPLLEAFLEAITSLDDAFARACKALVDEGMSRGRAYSEAFQFLVLFGSHDVALTSALKDVSTGAYRACVGREVAEQIDLHWNEDSSLMQLYVLVQLASQQYGNRSLFAEKTADLINNRLRGFPYHLRLAVLHLARMGGEVSEAQKQMLVEALQSLPSTNAWVDTPIVDALESLGALRDEMWEQYDGIVAELRGILERKLAPEAWDEAYVFYERQTGHPYGNAYCEAVRSLSDVERAQFLAMACRTTSKYVWNTSFLMREMSRSVALGDAFALESIQPRLALPPLQNHGPQDAVDTFMRAHETLARLGAALPDQAFYGLEGRPERVALLGCAQLAYFHPDPRTGAGAQPQNNDAVSLLMSAGATQAITAISLVEWSHFGEVNPNNRFVARFREVCVDAARRSLREMVQPTNYFGDRGAGLPHRAMAVSILERFGDRSDLGLLRGLADDKEVGVAALQAIGKLEGI
ncbi:nuclease-related domain-containing protein [Roseateles sp. LYH14W]|uniref:NERD domain-containing protein n=1 Tax=Pelomonas parva TaxID=3299032 RepID=A0ABW7F295_9BURK